MSASMLMTQILSTPCLEDEKTVELSYPSFCWIQSANQWYQNNIRSWKEMTRKSKNDTLRKSSVHYSAIRKTCCVENKLPTTVPLTWIICGSWTTKKRTCSISVREEWAKWNLWKTTFCSIYGVSQSNYDMIDNCGNTSIIEAAQATDLPIT